MLTLRQSGHSKKLYSPPAQPNPLSQDNSFSSKCLLFCTAQNIRVPLPRREISSSLYLNHALYPYSPNPTRRWDETNRFRGPDSQIPFWAHIMSRSITVFAGDRTLGRARPQRWQYRLPLQDDVVARNTSGDGPEPPSVPDREGEHHGGATGRLS